MDTFLEWLAISTVIGHWDTYGGMSHNFYLYNNPETGQLTWISWDLNLTMGGGRDGGMIRATDANTEQAAERQRSGMGRNTSLGN